MTKRVMILATDGFEQSELMKPKANLEKASIETEVVSLEEGSIRGWDEKNWGESVAVDKTVDAIENCDGYDALLLPGGPPPIPALRDTSGRPCVMLGRETAPGRVRQQPDLQVGVQVTTAPSSGLSRRSDASHDSSQRRGSRPSPRDRHLSRTVISSSS